MKKIIGLFIPGILIFLSSCTKSVDVELPEYTPKICIDARIEQNGKPLVFITKNAPYFGSFDFNNLSNFLVTNAFVTINDGITIDTLTHLGFGFYTGNLTGIVNRYYTLNVVAEGKTYFGSTRIPPPVPLDSIWFKAQETLDSLGFVWAILSDPPGQGQNYRWFAKRLNKDADFIPPLGSVFDDKFIDGQTFDFAYNRGIAPNSSAPDDLNQERGYFKVEDTIAVKFTTIDRDAYIFFRGYETALFSDLYPQNEVLGVFVGYGVWIDTLISRR
jgi:hypothetical protein